MRIDNLLAEFFMAIGSSICHQLPSRTIYINNMPLPVCARDTGIYIGVFFALIYIFLKNRFNSDRPPGIKLTFFLCILMLPMIYDGVTSYIGLRDTSNILRLYTGALFGIPMPFFIVPIANYKIYEKNSKRILMNWKEAGTVIVLTITLCTFILKTNLIPWLLLSTILTLTLVFLVGRIVYSIFIHTRLSKRKYFNTIVLGTVIVVFAFMFIMSNIVLHPLVGV